MPVETRKRKAMAQAAIENAEPVPSPPSSATKRQKKLPVRSKDTPEEQDPAKATPKQNKVITFDDDGNADQELVIPAPKPHVSKPEEHEESDSDEAPEAVSTAKVAGEMKKSALAEKRAAQGYVASTAHIRLYT
jgi:hypothetical protein